jgi:hypothetical protein
VRPTKGLRAAGKQALKDALSQVAAARRSRHSEVPRVGFADGIFASLRFGRDLSQWQRKVIVFIMVIGACADGPERSWSIGTP